MEDHMEVRRKRQAGIGSRVALTALAALTVAVAAAVPAGARQAADAKPLIIWLEQGSGNPYWDAQHAGAAAAGARLGFAFKAVSGNLKASDQANILKQLVDQKPAAIMLNAVDPKSMTASIAYANSKKVPVVNVYSLTPANATAGITFDETRSGRIDAQYALKLLEQRYGKAQGKVAVLHGILGQPASDVRANGFIDYMKKNAPGVKIVSVQPTGWAADKAAAAMQNWLVKYPDLSLVYSLSDTLAVPAAKVAERQNRLCTKQDDWKQNSNCVAFVSVDGIFADEVAKGRLFSTELYSPYWTGYTYATLAQKVATGKPYAKKNMIDSLLVTPDNAACVVKMANAMAKTKTFDFSGSLQQIAKRRGCKVVD
jgi:ABC-type sugar transport system substrate-binding protein